jgi:hypothetical protein
MTLNFKTVSIGVLILAVLILMAYAQAVIPASAIQSSDHANDKHGWLLATSIVECIAKNGPYMGMKFRAKDGKFYIPCQLADGRIGLGIFDKHGENVTAYVPRDGLWEQVKEYILQRAARYTGPLPW